MLVVYLDTVMNVVKTASDEKCRSMNVRGLGERLW